MSHLEAVLTFTMDTGDKPVAASTGPSGRIEHRGTFERRRVEIRDARPHAGELSLDGHGFRLVTHRTRVGDFSERRALDSVYTAEIERLIAEVAGAQRVVVFDHTLRSSDAAEQEALRRREPLNVAHNDYTERSGPTRLRLALPEEAEQLLDHRFAIIQVWRATDGPIERDPLALCDPRTVRVEDLLPAERRHRERVGEIYQLIFHPAQRWSWFPRMTRDEALLFKVYDSATDGRARFVPHASFSAPTTPPEAGPRRSIESRALALFER